MKSVKELLDLSISFFKSHQLPQARRNAEDLLAALLNVKRMDLYLKSDLPLEENEIVKLRSWIKRRANREPLGYILGQVSFYNANFLLNPFVLVPRNETEILVDKIATHLKKKETLDLECWDLCTGSGCIGISLKKALPSLKMTLIDISKEALSMAEKNAKLNDVSVEIVQSDLLESLKGRKADIIICNPPYISEDEYKNLESEVRDFEPSLALLAGSTGLLYYQKLAEILPSYLNPSGQVFFEIGASQGKSMMEIFSANIWKTRRLGQDWAGHDRFFFLEKQEDI